MTSPTATSSLLFALATYVLRLGRGRAGVCEEAENRGAREKVDLGDSDILDEDGVRGCDADSTRREIFEAELGGRTGEASCRRGGVWEIWEDMLDVRCLDEKVEL